MKKNKIKAWITLARLGFYPFNFVIYSMGALIALKVVNNFNITTYIFGFISILIIEIGVAFTNDYFDYETDKINKNAGQFNGGSQVLVKGHLSFKDVRKGMCILIILLIISSSILIISAINISAISIIILLAFGIFLGWGYTTPPLKFSYRGLGEFVSSFSGGPLIIFFGYYIQTGIWTDPLPWLLSIPIFLATFGSAIIPEIADYIPDKKVNRKTLPVLLGPKRAILLSIWINTTAAISGIYLWYFNLISGPFSLTIFIVIPHLFLLYTTLFKLLDFKTYNKKIDGTLKIVLSYMFWYALIPVLTFLIK